MNRKIKKFIFISLIFFGLTNSINAEERGSKWVKQITIPEGSRQTYLPKAGFFGGHSTWSPVEPLKKIRIGDTITGSDGKDKTSSFTVGVILCDYMEKDFFDKRGYQYSWGGKWSCIAARSKRDIKQFYNYREDRKVDVFTTSPINAEGIWDGSTPEKYKFKVQGKEYDLLEIKNAEYRCLWKEGFASLDDIQKYIQEEKKRDPELGQLLENRYKTGATDAEFQTQEKFIEDRGGCKEVIIGWIVANYSEDDSANLLAMLAVEGWMKEDTKLENIPYRKDSYFDKTSNTVYCKEPIPEMSLSEDANPSKKEIKNLCSCIWNKYPQDGWERKVLVKMFNNNSGTQVFRERNLRKRLPYAYQECGGYKL